MLVHEEYTNTTVAWFVEGLIIDVILLKATRLGGVTIYKITPVVGRGERWVDGGIILPETPDGVIT